MTDSSSNKDAYRRGRALQHAGRLTEAAACYREALSQRPDDHRALYQLGMLAHRAGNIRAAESLLRSAISFAGNEPDYPVALGQLLEQTGRPKEAIEVFRAAVSADPTHFAALLHLATLQQKIGDTVAALGNYELAIELDGDHLALLVSIARLLNDMGDSERAARLSTHAITLKPDLAPAHTNLGVALAAASKHGAAVEAFKRSLTLQPHQPDVYARLGSSLAAAGNHDRARHAFENCLRREPGHIEALSAMAGLLAQIDEQPPASAIIDFSMVSTATLTAPPGTSQDNFLHELSRSAADSDDVSLLPARDAAVAHLVTVLRQHISQYIAARPQSWQPLPSLGDLWPAPLAWRLALHTADVSGQPPRHAASWLSGLVYPGPENGSVEHGLSVAFGQPGENTGSTDWHRMQPGEILLFPSFFRYQIEATGACVTMIKIDVIARADPPAG
ncbi:MAG: tetratricopeptide repeat protein [Gammaproteobacteria bacterium]|nr:tetratricopeptide repeat protein [Gammaproteobacteria bacterium]NNF59711.1 tetratricopeptide repeat protein [Gammaproteobacteria bacterium]